MTPAPAASDIIGFLPHIYALAPIPIACRLAPLCRRRVVYRPLVCHSVSQRGEWGWVASEAGVCALSSPLQASGGLARSAAAQQYRSVQSHDAAGRQGCNFGLAVTDLSQHLPGVLAEA